MKSLFLICLVIARCAAAPVLDAKAEIFHYDNTQDEKGNYDFSFKTSNGIQRIESGRFVNAGQADEHIEVQGSYTYRDSDGKLVDIHYIADENGYHIVPIFSVEPVPASSPAVLATLLG